MLLLYGNASTSFITKAPEVFGFQGSSLSYTFDTIIITYMLMPCWDKVCQLTQAPQNYLMPMHEYGVRYDKIHSGHRKAFGDIYDINQIQMTIFQPRRDNVSTYTISKDVLLKWADEVLAPTAQLAYVGEGEFKSGDHCQFCKVKATCRKRAEYNLELAKYDFEMPTTLDDIEIASILAKVDEMISWGNDIKEYALQQAQSGVHFDGWKIVEGRSNRKFTDEAAVAFKVKDAGYDPYEKKLLGITAMSTLLGKKKFEELLGELVYKPPGKPALVPESDKRPAMNTAIDDFSI